MDKVKNVDDYMSRHQQWADELALLRDILNATELEETIKWGAPIYCLDGKNVVGIGAFKSYVGLWFHQGALLTDPDNALINAQDGKTKALRQWRFQNIGEINTTRVSAYVSEAIENQRGGKQIKAEKKPLVIPALLQNALDSNADLSSKFNDMGLSKQREFAEHIASAKREATQQSRLEKILPMIKQGIGLNDKYRK